jgi:hypothetical protein
VILLEIGSFSVDRLRHGPGPPGRAGPGPVFGPVRAYNVYDRPESPGVAKSPPRACQALISLYYNCNNLCSNHRITKQS